MAAKRYDISKEFLEREYTEKGRSLRDIAADFGCDKKTVSNKLRKFGIPARKNVYTFADIPRQFLEHEYVKNRRSINSIANKLGCEHHTISKKMAEYGIEKRDDYYHVARRITREFLEHEYIDLHKTMREIADKMSCDRKTIEYHLNKFGISARTYDHSANHVEITEDLLEMLDGTLLGDGYLGTESGRSAHYSLGQKHKEYVEYMAGIFEDFGITTCGLYTYKRKLDSGKTGWSNIYVTHSFVELLEQQKRWYPDGEKIVPKDIRITPLSLRTWFLEDGCFYTGGNNALGQVNLSTCSFTKDDVSMLVEMLNDTLNTKHVRLGIQHGGGFGGDRKYPMISFGHRDAVRKFFDYIAPLPDELKCKYGYKYLNN